MRAASWLWFGVLTVATCPDGGACSEIVPVLRHNPHRSLLQTAKTDNQRSLADSEFDAASAVAALDIPVLEEPPEGVYTLVETPGQMKDLLEDPSRKTTFAQVKDGVVLLRVGAMSLCCYHPT